MKIDEVYGAWKDEKVRIDIRESFSDEVMCKIYQYEQGRGGLLFDRQQIVEFIYSHRLVRVVLVAAAGIAGFVRIAFVVFMFLAS
ncbi:MAG: hypothetical protein JSV82_05865 [Planctomycetota bacterium]|nr:MAG: hypothetical protein JSV82_05865 [Planctomycetota bacterium]